MDASTPSRARKMLVIAIAIAVLITLIVSKYYLIAVPLWIIYYCLYQFALENAAKAASCGYYVQLELAQQWAYIHNLNQRNCKKG